MGTFIYERKKIVWALQSKFSETWKKVLKPDVIFNIQELLSSVKLDLTRRNTMKIYNIGKRTFTYYFEVSKTKVVDLFALLQRLFLRWFW